MNGIFHGQMKKNLKNTEYEEYVFGNDSFTYCIISDKMPETQIDSETESDDDGEEYYLEIKFRKKEWKEDEHSIISIYFRNGEENGTCDLEFKQTLIPMNDQYGNCDQLQNQRHFWETTVFRKGLSVQFFVFYLLFLLFF